MVGLNLWPTPVSKDGTLNMAFAVPTVNGREATDLDVGLYNITGRRVATLARGPVDATGGVATITWAMGSGSSGPEPCARDLLACAPSPTLPTCMRSRKVVVTR